MIKSIVAVTREIDDVDAAVSEILSVINPEKNLLKNSLGIISCFSEFEDTGVLKAVCDALPFECIGATTCMCAGSNQVDQVLFTITVLTSDDCDFGALKVHVGDGMDRSVKDAVKPYMDRNGKKPVMFFSFFPLINAISGDTILDAVDNATGGLPIFGATAVDHNMDYSMAKTILNGEAFREDLILAPVYGNVNAKFEVASLNEKKLRSQKAIITESDVNILISVNGKSALEYLTEIGLTKVDLETGLGVLPLAVGHNDGRMTVARAVFALTPEGYAVCGGAMPVNATLSVGHIDAKDVVEVTKSTVTSLVKDYDTILGYSCRARFFAQGANKTAESEIDNEITNDVSCAFSYVGGEICPMPDDDGKLKNFYHNFTVIFCCLN
ncbi:MAG: FIST C-terminal domain-containing protein [Clostridiales bacterium]|jgi:hypothetical protein|nr:FIST C-terminal domain-containing protein [Clostridiales bacterium]